MAKKRTKNKQPIPKLYFEMGSGTIQYNNILNIQKNTGVGLRDGDGVSLTREVLAEPADLLEPIFRGAIEPVFSTES